MRYAILQNQLAPMDVERVRRAIHGLAGLVAADADVIARNTAGIVKRSLDANAASNLHAGLRREGFDVTLLLENQLPEFPAARLIKRLELTDNYLRIGDLMNRQLDLEWGRIQMIAVGLVVTTVFSRTRTPRPAEKPALVTPIGLFAMSATCLLSGYPAAGLPNGGEIPEHHIPDDYSSQEMAQVRLQFELYIDGDPVRLAIEAEQLAGIIDAFPRDRKTDGNVARISALVQELVRRAPRSLLNRGARELNEQCATVRPYLSAGSFKDEVVWQFWNQRRAKPLTKLE